MKKQNIVLVGFKGAGKTTFGRALAEVSGLPFADLDQEVEYLIGESIYEFVDKYGWQVFREVEQRVTHDFCRNFSGVVATGGGTIENSKNLQNLKKTGNFIFLNTEYSDVRQYLLQSEEEKKRPRMNPDIPLAMELDQMWNQRKGIYSATADVEVSPQLYGDPKEEAQKILSGLTPMQVPDLPSPKKIVLLGSGNARVLDELDAMQQKGRLPNVTWAGVVCNQADTAIAQKATAMGVPVEVLVGDNGPGSEDYDRGLINVLRGMETDLIFLADWEREFTELYRDQFGSLTIETHECLLPNYHDLRGDEIYEKVLEYEDKYTGASLHRLTKTPEGSYELMLQRKVVVQPDDTVQSLTQRVRKQQILGFCEILEKR